MTSKIRSANFVSLAVRIASRFVSKVAELAKRVIRKFSRHTVTMKIFDTPNEATTFLQVVKFSDASED